MHVKRTQAYNTRVRSGKTTVGMNICNDRSLWQKLVALFWCLMWESLNPLHNDVLSNPSPHLQAFKGEWGCLGKVYILNQYL